MWTLARGNSSTRPLFICAHAGAQKVSHSLTGMNPSGLNHLVDVPARSSLGMAASHRGAESKSGRESKSYDSSIPSAAAKAETTSKYACPSVRMWGELMPMADVPSAKFVTRTLKSGSLPSLTEGGRSVSGVSREGLPMKSRAEPGYPSHTEKRAPALDRTRPPLVRRHARTGSFVTRAVMAFLMAGTSRGRSYSQTQPSSKNESKEPKQVSAASRLKTAGGLEAGARERTNSDL
mmetsp:Transcript_18840/g.31510  ORF Transcript_18840/g.31510 Transcript_18840/m.31510 type:complete len:235 (-) Transcript_18840:346-1050(-)